MQLTIVGGGGFRVPAMIDVLSRSRAGQGAYASLDVDRVEPAHVGVVQDDAVDVVGCVGSLPRP